MLNNFFEKCSIFWENCKKTVLGRIWLFFRERGRLKQKINNNLCFYEFDTRYFIIKQIFRKKQYFLKIHLREDICDRHQTRSKSHQTGENLTFKSLHTSKKSIYLRQSDHKCSNCLPSLLIQSWSLYCWTTLLKYSSIIIASRCPDHGVSRTVQIVVVTKKPSMCQIMRFSLYCINGSIESRHIAYKNSNNTLLVMKSELRT